MKKFFDLNATIRHKSFGELRREHEQQDKKTRTFFKALILLVILVTIITAVWQIVGA
jgi:hypothetical protein